jgi:hypothetical protein
MSFNKCAQDGSREHAVWSIRKFASEEAHKTGVCYEDKVIDGNILLNEGINQLWTILCSSGGTKFDNSNAFLAVGDDTTSENASQTGLIGTNKFYKAVDVGYPTFGTSQKATWVCTYIGTEANFGWQEFSVANGNSNSATNLNRKVSNQGTKTSGQVWELTLEITLS